MSAHHNPMKKFLTIFATIPFLSSPAYAYHWHTDRVYDEVCYKEVYTEKYIPGRNRYERGRIVHNFDKVEVPCYGRSYTTVPTPRPTVTRTPSADGNECIEGTILGGILGGGIGAAISRGDGRWWAIPTGVVAGSLVGCDIDGG
jgi:hypothetical protein